MQPTSIQVTDSEMGILKSPTLTEAGEIPDLGSDPVLGRTFLGHPSRLSTWPSSQDKRHL